VPTGAADKTGDSLSPWWRHVAILVMVGGFSVLSVLKVLTYKNAPPIPAKVTDPGGTVLLTREDIERGQDVFLKHGLMEHGTLWGHGAYLGPDYSAEYLHRLAEITQDTIAVTRFGRSFAQIASEARSVAAAEATAALRTNRYDATAGSLVFTPGEAASLRIQQEEWSRYFGERRPAPGLPDRYIRDPEEIRVLTGYFAWAAWATVAPRPGKDYSYTNNFPYEPLIGNRPPPQAFLWSALSLVTLLGGLGLVLFMFGKFDYLGWRGEQAGSHVHEPPATGARLTPSQLATAKYFGIVGVLLRTGGCAAHAPHAGRVGLHQTPEAGVPQLWT
jgi:nitric oxide reductase subunit B